MYFRDCKVKYFENNQNDIDEDSDLENKDLNLID